MSLERPGIISFSVSRDGNSNPASLTIRVVADEVLDAASIKRFYPFLRVRLYDEETGIIPFVGRLDTAQLMETPNHGRVWDLRGRDYLSVLADNNIDAGTWASGRNGHLAVDPWVANYVGDYDDLGSLGEVRQNIVTDLALNIVTNTSYGIANVVLLSAPNSKPIEVNLDKDRSTKVLDAIRALAGADPYSSSGQVDSKDIADAGFPAGSGFGAEFQMDYFDFSSPGNGGQLAVYYRRDSQDSFLQYSYGTLHAADAGPIIEYRFDREGADIYSRAKPYGRGEGIYDKPTAAGGGTGVQVPGMETTWDPEAGLFKVRRDSPIRFDGTVGDRLQEDSSAGEAAAIRARALRDAAYGKLFSGAAALQNSRGGPKRGSISVPGLPTTGSFFLRPGQLLTVFIPQEGIEGEDFTCVRWVYRFPEDITTIEVARAQSTDLSEGLMESARTADDAASAQNSFYDSGWLAVDGSGQLSLKHSLGVRAGTVKVEMARKSGEFTTDSLFIPMLNTETDVVPAAFDPSQGQNHGYAVIENTPYNVTIKVARWATHSDGWGAWLKNNDSQNLIRVRLYP